MLGHAPSRLFPALIQPKGAPVLKQDPSHWQMTFGVVRPCGWGFLRAPLGCGSSSPLLSSLSLLSQLFHLPCNSICAVLGGKAKRKQRIKGCHVPEKAPIPSAVPSTRRHQQRFLCFHASFSICCPSHGEHFTNFCPTTDSISHRYEV